ncbi:hypothetical protein M5D96_009217 [Drosophila gunungcola]|uniref:Uncharacterized protein n=1 Tax=Drosophila gunungcola TaxID=103775 RepID=A0A9Q0BMJ4_9MUSC|nr:hypothetical protein M5D96_009217 [Drosophila gunungcola]
MKPKVLIASLLPLLSAIASMGSHRTHRHGRLSNQITAPPRYEQCEDYKDISSWMAEHLKLMPS